MKNTCPVIFALAVCAAFAQAPATRTPPPQPGRSKSLPAKPPAAATKVADLKFPPLRPVNIPQIETATLANGIRLYLLEDRELPLVSGLALVRTGNLFDPPDKVGLATIVGVTLRSGGMKAKTGDELDEQLENIAAAVESQIGETFGSVSFSALKQNTDEVLEIFQNILTGPEFRQDKIDLIKGQLRSSIARRNDDPGGIASREFSSLVYGRDTPYGTRMEYEHIDRIQREDVVAFYRRYFFPSNIMLAVRGDFSAPEMKAKLEKLFGPWGYTQPPVPPFPNVQAKPTPAVYLGTKTDVTQTFLTIGHLGGTLRDKDFPALQVATDILGGGFSSRLFQHVRTQLGYAYNVGAAWAADYNHPGLFRISASTKSLSTTDTIKAILQEVDRMRSSEVTDSELREAKERVLNSFVFNFDTKAKTLNRVLTYEYFGYPKDFIYQYQKAVEAVTRADILRVAKEHYRPQQTVIVAVGNPADFGQSLETLGLPVASLDLTIPEPKRVSAAATPETLKRGRELLQLAQAAVGGADKLEAIQDFVEIIEFQVAPGFGGMNVRQTDKWIRPEVFRQDGEFPFGRISTFFDGKTGWVSTPRGMSPLPPTQQKQVEGELFRLFFRLLLSDRMPDRTVNHVGGSTIEIADKTGNLVRLTVDESSGLPRTVEYISIQANGTPADLQETIEAFGEFGGVKAPSRVSITQAGKKFADVVVQEYRFNTGLKLEELSKRP